MEKIIYNILLENLEVVAVKDGGGDSTAIALTYSTISESQNQRDIEIAAKNLAKEINNRLKSGL